MKYITFDSEANFIVKIVLQASKLIKAGLSKIELKKKNGDDLVTNLDLEAEKFLLGKMKERFPDYLVVSEEYNPDGNMSENCYTIDPIDGTVNFANGLGHWSIQVGLISGGKNVVSVLYFPVEDELFVATLGGGAYLNGKRISVRLTEQKDTVYNFVVSHKVKVDNLKILGEIESKISRHFRCLGSQSVAFASVACGRLGATFFGNYTRWDIEPGRLLVEEAGGKVFDNYGKYIIAANSEQIVKKFDEIVRPFFETKGKKTDD